MNALATVAPTRVYENMLRSNLQPEEKNMIADWAKKMIGPLETLRDIRIQDAPGGFLSAFRQGSEGVLLAAALAYAHANLRGGLDVRGVPVDGAAGFAVMLASAFMGHSELGTDARNLGQDATVICTYRKLLDGFIRSRQEHGRELYAHLMQGNRPASQPANDPVAAAAAGL